MGVFFIPLVKDEEGIWRMDYEDMGKKIKAHNIHVAIFCNPHNPCGRVWERWELEKACLIYFLIINFLYFALNTYLSIRIKIRNEKEGKQ